MSFSAIELVTVNQWVPGSSPGRGANFFTYPVDLTNLDNTTSGTPLGSGLVTCFFITTNHPANP